MGEAPDFAVGDRLDMLLAYGQDPRDLRFRAEVTYVWERAIDVRAGEQVFRVPRGALIYPLEVNGPYLFRPHAAEELIELADYDPAAEAVPL